MLSGCGEEERTDGRRADGCSGEWGGAGVQSECRAEDNNGKKKEGLRRILLVLDDRCGYAADLDIKSLYVTDPNVPSVVVFSAPVPSTYLMTSFASTA